MIGAFSDPSGTKAAQVRAQGASETIDYAKESLRTRVKELTDGKGADIIFEIVGGKVFDECVRW